MPRTLTDLGSRSDRISSSNLLKTYDSEGNEVLWYRAPEGPDLRPYQQDAVQAIIDALHEGKTRVGVSSPTGSGKTVMFTALIPRIPEDEECHRVLILVHNIELARQARQTIEKHYRRRYSIGVEQGGNMTEGDCDITIATWQSLLKQSRLNKFDPARFKLVIADEAHHNAAPSYLKILSYFNNEVLAGQSESVDGPVVPIVGFSATFARGDGKMLGWVYQEIVYNIAIEDLLRMQYLSPVLIRSCMNRILDIVEDYKVKDVPITDGMKRKSSRKRPEPSGTTDDEGLADIALSKVASDPRFPSRILSIYQQEAQGCKSTLIFVDNLAKVQALVNTFKEGDIEAHSITSQSERDIRVKTLKDFAMGRFPVMVNCLCLTEGTDLPIIDCVILARPTKSRNYFSQMIGRGLRLSPGTGKEACLVIDLFDICTEYGLGVKPSLWGDSKPNHNLELVPKTEIVDESDDD